MGMLLRVQAAELAATPFAFIMAFHFLLLLICLCTLSSFSPVLAQQRETSTPDTSGVEFVRQSSSHSSSRQEGLITVHHSERINMHSSTNGVSVLARRLLPHGDRKILAINVQDVKEEPEEKVHNHDTKLEKGSSADTKPVDERGPPNSTNKEVKSGDKETDISGGSPPPPVKPEDKESTLEKEREVNNTTGKVEKSGDQVKDNNTIPDTKTNAPAIHCGESHCEDPKKLVSACLQTPGDGAHKLSLFITYEGDSEVLVKVVAPEYLVADPLKVSVSKGKSETIQFLYEPSMLDLEAVNKSITVITDHGECEIAVPLEHLRGSVVERKPQFSSYLPSVTPRVVAYLVALVLVVALVGAWLCYKCCGKKRAGDVKYQQLEMIVPGQSTPKERDEQHTEGWDEVWDDDWEDAEAAKSSSRLSQNLSSRGLGARRGMKDGWDSSWED